tara:strand:- start:31723 stop:32742 length:1020 start_codon:yes stop_codon:yes gene_type:complete
LSLESTRGILITGGTGSFGSTFVKYLLEKYPEIPRIVIFSRDEKKQWDMQNAYPSNKYPQLRFFIGDIRDRERFKRALHKVDIVIHAAALKHVVMAENNPIEYVNTNVIGSENIVQACLEEGVKKVIGLSTDKAAAPINLYGATKLCAEKLFLAANNIRGDKETIFSVVKYGNVMGSRGSVIPFFLNEASSGILPITDEKMTRFNITLLESIKLVEWSLKNSKGGEVFVPKIPSYKITDVANAIGPTCEKKVVGIRKGEKLHEEMITFSDSENTYDIGKYYLIKSNISSDFNTQLYDGVVPKQVPKNFRYASNTNNDFLTIEEIRNLIKENVNKDFVPL